MMARQLGYLDSAIFVYALYPQDERHARCKAILADLQTGEAEGRLDPLVLHELVTILPTLKQFPDRAAAARYLRGIVGARGVIAEQRDLLLAALVRWTERGGGFTDAWLAILALTDGQMVCAPDPADLPDVVNSY
jgi:predicted nucleic acid-binding protein